MVPLVVALALVAAAALVVAARSRARARRLADAVRGHVEPYVRRKAAEAGILADPPTWTSRTPVEDIVDYSCRLATRLNDRERGASPGDSLELGRTLPAGGDRAEGSGTPPRS